MNRTATFELTLTRFIRAPREKVFDAFVTEAGMKGWMCPRGMTIPEMKLDARVGGGFRLTMRARDGEQFSAQAHYRELTRPERLVYNWQWVGEGMPNMETLITVTLA
ncbi:MAG: SRPBCC domain-containing protein, partial [Burkholderiales bacterium]